MSEVYSYILKGFLTGASLIIAIGAQNAYVLKQGLLKNHLFVTALLCSIIDACLIALGIGGFGLLITSNPILLLIAKWGGAAFLIWYGFNAFKSVFKSQELVLQKGSHPVKPSFKKNALTILALSFLNPHVYLDTVVLLGSIGSQYTPKDRPLFALGAMVSSFVWFFGLSYGAQFLAPLFKKPITWKFLDFGIGCVMWGIALSLLLNDFSAAK